MAFADALVTAGDGDVVLVDRRHAPGGHWLDAYPFVRLHQPSAYYGVNSLPLGQDRVDETGPNAGLYERATSTEICAYYEEALRRLLATGRVRFLGMTDHVGGGPDGHVLRSRLGGRETTVRVRRKVVDATYLESEVPSRHTPSFEVDPDARLVPPNDLVRLGGAAGGYTVLGSGKTAMDTCTWLLEQGVAPDRMRWIKPRDLWTLNRERVQPLDQVASVLEGVSFDLESAALATSVEDLFRRLEACGQLLRVDEGVEPTMFRGATLRRTEVEQLRAVEHVVRLGRVRRVGARELELEGGTLPTEPGHVHVDCTAAGLPRVPGKPIFEPGRITVQTIRLGLTPFNSAVIGHVEATRPDDDALNNHLCPVNVYPDLATDWIGNTYTGTLADLRWGEDPELSTWLERARLNLVAGMRAHFGEPRVQEALTRLLGHRERALENLQHLQTTL